MVSTTVTLTVKRGMAFLSVLTVVSGIAASRLNAIDRLVFRQTARDFEPLLRTLVLPTSNLLSTFIEATLKMRQGAGTLFSVLCGLFLLAIVAWTATTNKTSITGLHGAVVGGTALTIQVKSLREQEEEQEEEDFSVQQVRRLVADADEETIARFKADPPGYRWHPSYYSDKYLTRAKAPDGVYGSWNLIDNKRSTRPDDTFYTKYTNRDVPWAEFPTTAWQKDPEYLPKYLDEGIALAERAMEAILMEYGYGKDRDDTPFEERIKRLGPKSPESPGVADLVGNSYQGLVRRVLHAIVTEDTFVLGMAGHSSAAAHGNHFQQSYTLAYNQIMEPIFARLGVHASARNFGSGGMGTIQTGIAAAAVMGPDVDILVWDSGMTEKGPAIGVLAVQYMLGGNRVPIFIGADKNVLGFVNTLNEGDADGGIINEGQSFTARAETQEELEALPWAAQCLNFGPDLKPACGGNTYRGKCWLDRSHFYWGGMNMSFVPGPGNIGNDEPGGRASWHYGDRRHQARARAYTGLVLHAIRDALLLWKNSTDFVLNDEDWHVTTYYNNIRTKITTDLKEKVTEWCVQASLPERVCQVPMQARTDFTPRYDPARNTINSIMKSTRSPFMEHPAIYDPPDVFNPNLHAPEGSIDVLAIVESGIPFAPNLGRIRRRMSLPSAKAVAPPDRPPMNPEIKPGRGWVLNSGSERCDGEYDSWCKRNEGNQCLLYAHNDGRGGTSFDGFSGWGVFELPNVREGLIMIKYHDWIDIGGPLPITAGWTTENNEIDASGRKLVEQQTSHMSASSRELKKAVTPYCDDFRFDFAIDGKITSWDKETWQKNLVQVQRVVQTTVLLDDPTFTGGQSKNVELAMRISGCQRSKALQLTHVYWS